MVGLFEAKKLLIADRGNSFEGGQPPTSPSSSSLQNHRYPRFLSSAAMAISTKPKTVIKRDKHNAKKSAPTLTSSLKASSAAATKATKAKASSAPAAVPAASIKGKEVATGPELDPNDVAYDKIYSKTRKIMGRKPSACYVHRLLDYRADRSAVSTVHAEEQNRVDHILRVFDLDISYGPCVGMFVHHSL